MAILQSDGVNHTSDLILRRNGTEGLRLTSSTVQVSSINNGPLAGFRNAIINGNFDFWQRGSSQTAAGYGSADRWQISFDGSGGARTISRQPFTVGQTAVPGEPEFFYRFNQTTAGSGATFNLISQRIEDVRTFAGQTVTLSFYASATSSLTMPEIRLRQGFGSGGSPSALVDTTLVSNISVSTSFTKFTYTATLPSISGKVIGSNGDSVLDLLLFLPINTTFTFNLAQVQIEPGSVATPFERRPRSAELLLCERYFVVLPAMQGAMDATNSVLCVTPIFRTVPRTGNITYTLITGTNAAHHPGSAFRNITAVSGNVNTINATVNVAFGANIPGQVFAGAISASAEL
jgi:hypothetical protein